jgi:hypothetical protein
VATSSVVGSGPTYMGLSSPGFAFACRAVARYSWRRPLRLQLDALLTQLSASLSPCRLDRRLSFVDGWWQWLDRGAVVDDFSASPDIRVPCRRRGGSGGGAERQRRGGDEQWRGGYGGSEQWCRAAAVARVGTREPLDSISSRNGYFLELADGSLQ